MGKDITTYDLGELSGQLLVFGGPYSNFQALTELRRIAEKKGITPKQIICTGDIVGYCAQPEESVRFVKEWGLQSIQGNVEQNIINGEDDCGCNFAEGGRCELFSRTWFPYASQSLSKSSVQWLATLPHHLTFRYAGRSVAVVHGSALHISDFIFKSTPWIIKEKSFAATRAEIILAGHAGLPFADERMGRHWLNAGVIGMPANDGTPRVWYLLLDDTAGQLSYSFEFFTYDCGTANQLMLENHLPATYAQTLLTGLWDNCEILPETEKEWQGIALDLANALP